MSVRLTFPATINNQGTTIDFSSWQGVPQLPRPVVDTMTRLGSNKLLVQKLRTEAIKVNSVATNTFANVDLLNIHKSAVLNAIGQRGKWVDNDSGKTINSFFILDAQVIEKVVDVNGPIHFVVWNITCTTDGA
jgi:hypothetical protein